MKKMFVSLIVFLLIPSLLFAAGSCTQTARSYTGGLVVITFVCTGDASNGSIPNTAISAANMALIEGKYYLYTVQAYPTASGTPPDAADVFILDGNGMDLLGSADMVTAGKGLNLIHATLPKETLLYNYHNSSYYAPPVRNALTLKVANQATVSANYTVELVFAR